MQKLAGKTAFVTGAASGIGLGIARVLARQGVNLALADLQETPLAEARQEIASLGVEVDACVLDVTDRDAMYGAAERIEKSFGGVDILINNAGVGYAGAPLDEIPDGDYDWVIGVNLNGVIHAIKAFVPLIKRTGDGGHVVNTASAAGLRVRKGWNHGLYSLTKFAVVALSEGLEDELKPHGVGVSVLCPGPVSTGIYDSGRNRPAALGGPFRRPQDHPLAEASKRGMSPDAVGERVARAIREDEFYIVTHPEVRADVEARYRRIMAACDLGEALAD